VSSTTFRELLQWQSHLDKTFGSLDATRNRQKGKPFFVLEHGLDEIDLTEVCNLVIEHGRNDLSFEKIELPFIVFATEIGFEYEDARHDRAEDTSDYWPMFDIKIPNWRRKTKNYRFFKYAFSQYLTNRYTNVYLPDGAWFETFPYISWPVYQAILCKDARQDLIRLMKRLNQEQDLGSITSPLELGEKLGREITRRVEQSQSLRLDQFQDQERLLGEIAYSIVKPENDLQVDFLSSYALDRLKQSLPLELLEVVEKIRANISRTVSRRQSSRSNSANYRTAYQGSSSNRLSGEINIFANKSMGAWQIQIEIPKLRSFENSIPQLRDLLHGTLHVHDQTNGRIPPKTLLYRGFTLPINQWPSNPMERIFDVEFFPRALANAIRGDWKMFASQDLLFKCDNEDAKLQRHFEISLNQKYLYIRRERSHFEFPKIFNPVPTTLDSSVYAYEFTLNEHNIDDAQPFIQAAQLVFREFVQITPVGQFPYIYEKEISCKYAMNQIADFRVDSAASALLATIAEEGSEEFTSVHLRRGEILRLIPKSPGSYWIRLETILGDEAVNALWQTDTIAAMRVDFLTPQELAEIGNLQIVMLSSVAHPSIEQIISSDVEVSFNGPANLIVDVRLEATDVDGELYPALDLNPTRLPISSEFVKAQFVELANRLSAQAFQDVSSVWWHIEANGMPIFKREFFSSRKDIRWQKTKDNPHTFKLIAKAVEAESFQVYGSSFKNPTKFIPFDSSQCVRSGVNVQDLMMLVPAPLVDQWPPAMIESLEKSSDSYSRTLDSALITLFRSENEISNDSIDFAFQDLAKEGLNNLLVMLQLLRNDMNGFSVEFNQVLNGPFLEQISAQLSIELIGPHWVEVEKVLNTARKSGDVGLLSDLIGSLPDLLDQFKSDSPSEFGWINTKGLWTGKEQAKVAKLSSAQRAIVLANKCLAPDKFLPPKPDVFSRFSEKQYRAFDLGLMLTINPLFAGERMMQKPIGSGGWNAFWENRRAISAYCRINHLLNLELGVEWTWN